MDFLMGMLMEYSHRMRVTIVGVNVGKSVGNFDGWDVWDVGVLLGVLEGDFDEDTLGFSEGDNVGCSVGFVG